MSQVLVVDGAKRGRPGKFLLDYRDGRDGRRRWVTFDTEVEALQAKVTVLQTGFYEKPRKATVGGGVTVVDYSQRWLDHQKVMVRAGNLRAATLLSYNQHVRLHIIPKLGSIPVASLTRAEVKQFILDLYAGGLKRGTVRNSFAVLRTILNAAVIDGVIVANPAVGGFGKDFRLTNTKQTRAGEIKALDADELETFLTTARKVTPKYHSLFFLLARTGMRLGEALALEWNDVDFANRRIAVRRSLDFQRQIGGTKTHLTRSVDMSAELRAQLKKHHQRRLVQIIEHGRPERPLVFASRKESPLMKGLVAKAMKKALAKAVLPSHFHPHCLRHTFASLLLNSGAPIQYVSQQLGHASIQLTVDTYGRWLANTNLAAVDRLDVGSKVVAKTPESDNNPHELSSANLEV